MTGQATATRCRGLREWRFPSKEKTAQSKNRGDREQKKNRTVECAKERQKKARNESFPIGISTEDIRDLDDRFNDSTEIL